MLTIRFKRTQDGVFVPHTDVLKTLNRTFRRAEIAVEYSKGFNRHMSLKMTQPLPLGVADGDCYVTADVIGDVSPEEMVGKFNDNCPPYLKAYACYLTEKNPSLAGAVTASEYRVSRAISDEQVAAINSLPKEYYVTVKTKDGEVRKDAGALIYSLRADNGGFTAMLAFGNVNLRIDKLCESFNTDFGTAFEVTDAERTAQYVATDEGYEKASEYLERMCQARYISK